MLDLLFATIAVLALFGSVVILSYLLITGRAAPQFSKSLQEIKPASDSSFKISVIIPARNEQETIANCLKSVSSQSYKNMEVIVVDDSSTDGTAGIVKSFENVKLLQAGAKPPGWVGKSWACWRGYESSRGEFLLFIDADSILSPTTVESTLNYILVKGIDIFSLAPRIEMKSAVARAVLPIITGAINLLYPMQKVNDRKSERAYVFGTFILVKGSVYAAVGGHERVREEIVEDAALARIAKKAGYTLRVERGREFVASEWETEASTIYRGLERVTSTSIRTYGLVSILNAVLLFFIMLYPIVFVISFAFFRGEVLFVGFVASILNIVTFLILSGYETNLISGKKFSLSPILYPVGSVFFIAAIVSTSIKVSRGLEITWKDQGYPQPVRNIPQDK